MNLNKKHCMNLSKDKNIVLFFKEFLSESGYVAQLVGCLPGTHKVLGSMLSTTHTRGHKFEIILSDRLSSMTAKLYETLFQKGGG